MNEIPDNNGKRGAPGERLLQRIALVAGVFSFVVCILMVANYIQLKKADPTNMQVITTLVERLNQNPGDTILREQIRTLDLLARKAYFTSQWQVRMGGYLLLAGLAVMLIALQWIRLRRKINPQLSEDQDLNIFVVQKKARNLILAGGGLLLFLALLSGFLTNRELRSRTSDATKMAAVQSDSAGVQSPPADSLVASVQPSGTDTSSAIAAKTSSAANEAGKAGAAPVTNAGSDQPVPAVETYPTFRGPSGNGIAVQRNIPVDWDGPSGKNILWKTATPLPGNSSPVIWGDKIYLTGASESKREVYCMDKNTGRILWTATVPKIPGASSQVPKASRETGFAAPTAAVNAQGVYAVFANGDLIALDHQGKQLWVESIGFPNNHYGHASSLMIYNDMLIIQFDQHTSAKIFAVNTASGKTIWSTNRQVKASWSSPILVPNGSSKEIITAAEPYVEGYDVKTGAELWKLEAITGEVGPSAAYANGIVFTVNDYSKLAAIKLGNPPVQLWESDEYLSDIPSPVATDKYLFLVTSYGVVACYDTQNGTKYWEKELNNSVFSSPVIAENRVYLIDRTGLMHIFKVDKEYVSLGEPKLGEPVSCTPAFANGRIFIRGEKNLYCIGK